jgi:hypothetical protein
VFWEQKDRLRALSAKDTAANRTLWCLKCRQMPSCSMWSMIITDRPRSDVVMDLDSKVNKSTLKLTINSDLSHKWLCAWLRRKHMQYEFGISIAICVSGRRLLTRRCISIKPKRASSGTWSPMTMRSFTPTAKLASVDDVQKSRLNTYEHALSAWRICATIEDEPIEKSIACANLTRVHTGYLVYYNSKMNYYWKDMQLAS